MVDIRLLTIRARSGRWRHASEPSPPGDPRWPPGYGAKTLWLGVAGVAVAAAVLGTLLAPRSRALSLLVGVGRFAGLALVGAGLAHGAAVWIVFFSGDGAPTPAYAVWLGVGGLAAVLVGCIIGPRHTRA